MVENISRREALSLPYGEIIEQSKPGDIVFFISKKSCPGKNLFRTIYRKWIGFDPRDATNWHTTVYCGAKKENNGSRFRPYLIHAGPAGVKQIPVPPEYFIHKRDEDGAISQESRLEIVQFPELSSHDREKLVHFCSSQLGKRFDNDERWYRYFVTYVLGIKSADKDPEKVSCHGMVFEAYHTVGFTFPHQLEDAPNLLGRVAGHPIGHPVSHVDMSSNYLRDHHLYRDPRSKVILSITGASDLQNIKIMINPEKYSWDDQLQQAYGILPYRPYARNINGFTLG